ncbi:hypothetical protein Tco_0513154, partial [Tanacetum coccineum]
MSTLLELEPDGLDRPVAVPAPKVTGVSSPSSKGSIVTPASSLMELLSKDAPHYFIAATEQPSQEQNKE